jgi:hypothetical protein
MLIAFASLISGAVVRMGMGLGMDVGSGTLYQHLLGPRGVDTNAR